MVQDFCENQIKKKEKKRGDAGLRIYGYWCVPLRTIHNEAWVTVDALDGGDLHG